METSCKLEFTSHASFVRDNSNYDDVDDDVRLLDKAQHTSNQPNNLAIQLIQNV